LQENNPEKPGSLKGSGLLYLAIRRYYRFLPDFEDLPVELAELFLEGELLFTALLFPEDDPGADIFLELPGFPERTDVERFLLPLDELLTAGLLFDLDGAVRIAAERPWEGLVDR
jgi:hypothetical protein